MDRSFVSEPLERLLLEAGLLPGPVLSVDGCRYRAWLRDGETVVVADDGDTDDLVKLHRLAWSSGCRCALVSRQGRIGYIDTVSAPSNLTLPRLRELGAPRIRSILASMGPCSMPGVVDVLVERMERWRGSTLRRALAERADWTEGDLSLVIEMPILDLLVGNGWSLTPKGQMAADLERVGVDLSIVPPALLALAWDCHLSRRLRLLGGEPTLVGSAMESPGPSRALLSKFASWAGSESKNVRSVLVPICGAGRLLLSIAGWAQAGGMRVFAIDPDPRAALFATRMLSRVAGDALSLVVRSANPLVEEDLFDGVSGQLIPRDARSRLRAVDWETIFGGVREFDRVLVGDPVLTMTRRREVRRYLEERYRSGGSGTDPALLLTEAGARHLNPGGRVLALYTASVLRSSRASMLRRWLAPRTEVCRLSDLDQQGAVALRIAPDPVETPIVTGILSDDHLATRVYPRTALHVDGWSFRDTRAAEQRRHLVTGCASLGEVLIGGIRPAQPFACESALLVGGDVRQRLVKADRRSARVVRPVIGPEDLVRFGTARGATRFVIVGELPPRASRVGRSLGVSQELPPDAVPPPSGPRLLFADGAPRPVFLCDRQGEALTSPGIFELFPANLFLFGLLHSSLIGRLIDERCPGSVTARCLSRLPVRLPDPYDPPERKLGDRIASLVRARIGTKGTREQDRQRRTTLESAIEEAVEDLYGLSRDRG
ncbi:hypothetical protein DSECCO2_500700 [anaerobic digester metagenome]